MIRAHSGDRARRHGGYRASRGRVAGLSARSAELPLLGQVAVVTGAGRGIGRATALALAGAGANVVCASRTRSEIDDTVRDIEQLDREALAVVTDIRDESAVQTLMRRAADGWGRLDVAVLNAGVYPRQGPIDRVRVEDWRECVDTNLTGTFLSLKAAVPHLRASGGGRIIVVGAGASRRAPEGIGPYAASKAALSTLVRVAARDLRASNIAVNELQPGPTATRLHGVADGDPDTLAEREVVLEEGLEDDSSIAGEWFKSPRNVAEVALFLACLPNHGPSGQIVSLNSAI